LQSSPFSYSTIQVLVPHSLMLTKVALFAQLSVRAVEISTPAGLCFGSGLDRPRAGIGLHALRDEAPFEHCESATVTAGLGADYGNELRRRDVEARLKVRSLGQAEAFGEQMSRRAKRAASAHVEILTGAERAVNQPLTLGLSIFSGIIFTSVHACWAADTLICSRFVPKVSTTVAVETAEKVCEGA
jgi:hypothetical protein